MTRFEFAELHIDNLRSGSGQVIFYNSDRHPPDGEVQVDNWPKELERLGNNGWMIAGITDLSERRDHNADRKLFMLQRKIP